MVIKRMELILGTLAASNHSTAMHSMPYNPPKISTIPRQPTEASILLDLHRLVSEKNRLQQEQIKLETRQVFIRDRLTQIELDRTILEANRAALRTRSIAPVPATAPPAPPPQNAYDITFLEY